MDLLIHSIAEWINTSWDGAIPLIEFARFRTGHLEPASESEVREFCSRHYLMLQVAEATATTPICVVTTEYARAYGNVGGQPDVNVVFRDVFLNLLHIYRIGELAGVIEDVNLSDVMALTHIDLIAMFGRTRGIIIGNRIRELRNYLWNVATPSFPLQIGHGYAGMSDPFSKHVVNGIAADSEAKFSIGFGLSSCHGASKECNDPSKVVYDCEEAALRLKAERIALLELQEEHVVERCEVTRQGDTDFFV
jgi:hypothetical protein